MNCVVRSFRNRVCFIIYAGSSISYSASKEKKPFSIVIDQTMKCGPPTGAVRRGAVIALFNMSKVSHSRNSVGSGPELSAALFRV